MKLRMRICTLSSAHYDTHSARAVEEMPRLLRLDGNVFVQDRKWVAGGRRGFFRHGTHGLENAGGVASTAHGHFAAPADFKDTAIVFAQDFNEALDLAFDAGHLDHQRFGSEIDDAGAEDFDEVEDLRAIGGRGGHLD